MKRPCRRLLASACSAALALAVGAGLLAHRRGEPVGTTLLRLVEPDPYWVRQVRRLEESRPPIRVRALPDSTLARELVRPDDPKARFLHALRDLSPRLVFDERAVYRLRPDARYRKAWPEHPDGHFVVHVNGAGLRGARGMAAERPDLRVLVTGDSHIEGVCNDDETTAARLEARLAVVRAPEGVEVLNAAVGGYCGYNQLGVLERHLPDGIDVFVQVFYGGNDFCGATGYRHFYERTRYPVVEPALRARHAAALERHPSVLGQGLYQTAVLAALPGEAELAARTARDLADETARVCAHHGVRFVWVYLPPANDVEWDAHRERLDPAAADLGLGPEALGLVDRMADELIAYLGGRGVEVIDARPLLRTGGPYFWDGDLHLSVRGHARLAGAIAGRLARGG